MRCNNDCAHCKYPDCIWEPPPQRQLSDEAKSHRRDLARLRRAERREAGQCTQCGQPLHDIRRMCGTCRAKYRAYKEAESRRTGVLPRDALDGVARCQKCGKDAPIPGYRLCQRCYDSNLAHLAKTPTHTGRGCVTPFAAGVDAFWRSMQCQAELKASAASEISEKSLPPNEK